MQIVERNDSNVSVIADVHGIAKLGESISTTHIISDASLNRAKEIMFRYGQIAASHNVDAVKAVATSAVREANNNAYVVQQLTDAFNIAANGLIPKLQLSIITGEEEAALTFHSVAHSICVADGKDSPIVVVDIGGGSTEIISGTTQSITNKVSVPFGVVKLTEMFNIEQPINVATIPDIRIYIRHKLSAIDFADHVGDVVAVSGTPTAMAAISLGIDEYDANEINDFMFSNELLEETAQRILEASVETLTNRYHIEYGRAIVLPAGAIILQEVAKLLNSKAVRVSTNGLRNGLALSMLEGK
jgi:exopolyphosphatase/guanosine-5'-triphosphate,3'-diphosphate pyrophosphatase